MTIKKTTKQLLKEIKQLRDHMDTCSYGGYELAELAELEKELEITESIEELTESAITCPLCEGVATHEEINGTHMWVCECCPFVGMEYVKAQDAVNVKHRLNNSI